MVFLFYGCGGFSQFRIRDLAKTDIDRVAEIHRLQATEQLKSLTEKLYRKNPSELHKAKNRTIDSRVQQIFTCPPRKFAEIHNQVGTDAVLLGLDPDFKGDRVFALVYGLYTMIHNAYNGKCDLYMLDYLSAQDLYNSARNIEICVWRLSHRHKETGDLLILTNTLEGDIKNLSYERLFGKLICLQDTMARIISDRTGRVIKEVAFFAGMAFLPIGI